jgi:hypothetical protein
MLVTLGWPLVTLGWLLVTLDWPLVTLDWMLALVMADWVPGSGDSGSTFATRCWC